MESCDADNSMEPEKQACNYVLKTVKINQDERSEVKLAWMQNVEELPINRDIATKRLISTRMKLLKNSQFESYDAVFEE